MNLFGLYVPAISWLHRLGAGWKYLLLLLLTVPVLAWAKPGPSLIALAVAMVLLVSARLRPLTAWALPLGFWLVAASLAAYQLLVGQTELAVVVVANLITAVYASRLLTMTTPGAVLIDALVSGLRPLRRLGVNPELVGLAIAVMLRSVPLLLDSFTQVRQAAQARGRERNLFAQVTPVVVRAVGHAQATGAALAARGLGE
ncbi:CbiQ family ECF transporter T component [Propionicimonas sp.]|jgi:biotin transport system permease protein|uniref:energy-coupling factor transporter transmembrane component T family protein n=1 Tax=Propionicimonas sp. TaxID=1955623 RepID=UPI0017AAC7D8|nr:CbiQ family ECF transporter T component [Propionicimonas sp.]MBU3977165.1 energy-coupling factor transporter transmembrane protein EcfT [Actinomycetota bacterium]MBA3021092.1 energy-coupling factor transporter transmembrane protein EcfT [Propionicimonas sp.]MBU3985675.1 energy-coupling factor transporter transmembrane protein EcfT [Actinomycetota bacterium]MBU4008460.1 energy-coupling factor transporter transmembrane protein EcfT [Actinomycetota bacterium]MBU4066390.1 energy-coupling factor